MEEKIKLSVIIKTKNAENSICNTLESIKDFDEIIIIDEHSADDTIEIAKEYKAKIIYADKNNLPLALNQALDEARNEWFFILEEDEIVPQKLISNIESYILNPKKNKFVVALNQKTFVAKKELKSARAKSLLRIFKKGHANFKNDFSLEIKPVESKIHKIKSSGNNKNACVLKFIEADFSKEIFDLIEKTRFLLKETKKNKGSVFIKPIRTFVYWYFVKGAIFDGKQGFIFAWKKYFEKLLFEVSINEKNRG